MFNDNFSEYVVAKESGADAAATYQLAEKNGLDHFARIRMLRSVFGLEIEEAKAVSLGRTIESLKEDQEKLIPAIENALSDKDSTVE